MLIRYFLRDQFAADEVCNIETWPALLQASPDQLRAYRLFQGHFQFDAARLFPACESIAFFRPPVERTLSLLLHLRRDPNFHGLHQHAKGRSIADLLNDPLITDALRNHQTAYLGTELDLDSARLAVNRGVQAFDIGAYMSEPNLKLAMTNLQRLSVIGLTNQIEASFARLCMRYDFHPRRTYPRRNSASDAERATLANLSRRELEILHSLNDLDLKLYDAASTLFHMQATAAPYEQLVGRSMKRRAACLSSNSDLDLSAPVAGSNWYEAERNEGGDCYRWSGPENDTSLEFPLGKDSEVQLCLAPYPGDAFQETLSWEIDGIPQAVPPLSADGNLILQFSLSANPASVRRGFHQVLLHHRAERPPAGADGDRRRLGFRLLQLKCGPGPSPAHALPEPAPTIAAQSGPAAPVGSSTYSEKSIICKSN